MTREQYDELIRAKPHLAPDREASSAKPESSSLPKLEGDSASQAKHPAQRLVVVTCFRVRKQDPDNGIYKWHIDAIRTAGLVHDDTEEAIEFVPRQVKVATKAEERTEITITIPI